MSVLFRIEDKHVPLYRVLWVSATPHYCGAEDCLHEGDYEVRLEQGEVVWASHRERDELLEALEIWGGGFIPPDESEELGDGDDDWT